MITEDFQRVDLAFPWFFPLSAAVIGACVGSFLNVCIYRIPKGESVVTPPSHCGCGKRIAWYDNVPVLSWLILRGRARCCGRPFSFRYPAIELLTAPEVPEGPGGVPFVWDQDALWSRLEALVDRTRVEGCPPTLTDRLRGLDQVVSAVERELPGPEASAGKMMWVEGHQRLQELAMEIEGPFSQLTRGSEWAVAEGLWQHTFLRSRANSIEGGTTEIQRNIIGERVLGLPKG